jgi:ferredoxin-NADP reductase
MVSKRRAGQVRSIARTSIYARVRVADLEPAWEGHAAGQFVNWFVDDGGPATFRPFTLVNLDDGSGELEFWIDHGHGGRACGYLASLRPGQEVGLMGPVGAFGLLPGQEHAPCLLLSQGVGVAPFFAMARTARVAGADWIRWFHESPPGAELPGDWVADATVGGLTVEGGGPGSVAERLRELQAPAGHRVYLCGGGDFIARAAGVLAELGLPPARMRSEKFW